ncbi:MAG TPA: type II secretion system major pseudopilin GspG [Myxococcota bacterium]|jgi:general secretion pathway protein G|nr:type II secretion system major pseudopilin GspG [Myxococcota bacterium]HNH47013.1 type II secretion system major pseudopilin GspG [Myxococcota bacterium]
MRRTLLRSRREGMTLVEIMISLSIIGIVMTVLLVNVVGYLDSANQDATRITIRRVEDALMVYSSKHKGKYPSSSDGIAAVKNLLTNEEVPQDAWGRDFIYVSPGTHGNHPYEIISLGKDGQEGGEGANADIQSWALNE